MRNGNARFIHERKLDALEDLIEAANGQPVLIAYWFKHDRQRIGIRLAKMGLVARNIKESQDIKDLERGTDSCGPDPPPLPPAMG